MGGSWELVAPDNSFDALTKALSATAGIGSAQSERVERQVLDTFDWRLDAVGLRLVHERGVKAGGSLTLSDATAKVIARQPVSEAPRLIADIPHGTLRERVGGEIGVRAVLVQLELDVDRVVRPVLNSDDKTVARVTVERSRCHGEDLDPRLHVQPLRGYEKATGRAVARLCHDLGLQPADGRSTIAEGFAVAGVVPGASGSKLPIALTEDEPAVVGMARLFLHLLATMEANEPGVRDDIDTEFLHDFRVAIRRTRSLLPLARACFPGGTIDGIDDGFRRLGRDTSTVRDLDVFLLGHDDLITGIASEWRDDLGKLEPFAVEQRERARLELLLALQGPWPELRDRWRGVLLDPDGSGGRADGATPTAGSFAREHIARAHRAVTKTGRRITEESPAAEVHRLRKRAKVLRYQLEAFSSLLPPTELREATAELRKLQDVLGTFQDHDVQVHTIRDFTERLTGRGDAGTDFLLAMGALRAHVREEREIARLRCAAAFARFDTPANRRRYRSLTAAPDETENDG